MTVWVSVEGVEGVGKSHLAVQLAARLDGRCALAAEITDQAGSSLPGRMIGVLSSAGDPFLRIGYPLAETLALIALKVREHEIAGRGPGAPPEMVLEDRGIDSVAVYQAIIVAGAGAPLEQMLLVMQRIYATAARWRPLPEMTLLLIDELDACIGRFEARLGRAVPPADRALIARAGELYAYLAASQSGRFAVIDRRQYGEADVVARMHLACLSRLENPCAT